MQVTPKSTYSVFWPPHCLGLGARISAIVSSLFHLLCHYEPFIGKIWGEFCPMDKIKSSYFWSMSTFPVLYLTTDSHFQPSQFTIPILLPGMNFQHLLTNFPYPTDSRSAVTSSRKLSQTLQSRVSGQPPLSFVNLSIFPIGSRARLCIPKG
jgi:hypothetical protein